MKVKTSGNCPRSASSWQSKELQPEERKTDKSKYDKTAGKSETDQLKVGLAQQELHYEKSKSLSKKLIRRLK